MPVWPQWATTLGRPYEDEQTHRFALTGWATSRSPLQVGNGKGMDAATGSTDVCRQRLGAPTFIGKENAR